VGEPYCLKKQALPAWGPGRVQVSRRHALGSRRLAGRGEEGTHDLRPFCRRGSRESAGKCSGRVPNIRPRRSAAPRPPGSRSRASQARPSVARTGATGTKTPPRSATTAPANVTDSGEHRVARAGRQSRTRKTSAAIESRSTVSGRRRLARRHVEQRRAQRLRVHHDAGESRPCGSHPARLTAPRRGRSKAGPRRSARCDREELPRSVPSAASSTFFRGTTGRAPRARTR